MTILENERSFPSLQHILGTVDKNERSFHSLRVPVSHSPAADTRRQHVLAAARRCFLDNGFHATSMQDILREAQMSPGNLYRYFPGKDAIVLAIVEATLADVTAAFEQTLLDEPPPLLEALTEILRAIERLDDDEGTPRLAIQIWGEALRNPAMASLFAEAITPVRQWFAQLVEAHQHRGLTSGQVPPEHLANVLLGAIHGFIVQRALLKLDAASYAEGLRGLFAVPAGPPNDASGTS
ncbi:TetR/AcrR family transcriptional regulator [Nonomuraea angiospora]|uniref:TetR/AcrR family transcriptional regulator n=1 Tax=Nonomuraea angiospora TaxID=46172 RepID=UPI0029B305B8|nr:TetR/AcrR family transcriptional regulator [Nonomuraea angiospora]MDX3100125.1 TetR/AcrR family transcriptional regulator [Nonomuraea angiospora]